MSSNSTDSSDQNDDNNSLALQNLRILLVEDNLFMGEILTDFLTACCGAEVTCVVYAAEALEILQLQRPDILLSNIILPDEDGYSLIQKIRNLAPEQGGQTPAIAITASVSETNCRRILEAGFQGYLAKPFEPESLVEMLANLAASAE